MQRTKSLIKRGLRRAGLELRRIEDPEASLGSSYSFLDEQTIALRYLAMLGSVSRYCVDIGANDGRLMSNTLALFEDGWAGFAAEASSVPFTALACRHRERPDIQLFRGYVTPTNVAGLLAAAGAPRHFGFLSLDIDGYDHEVLASILDAYRPALICCEINEKIPPPVRFTVRYDPRISWTEDHFYGQSIMELTIQAERSGYDLLELHYANAFLAPRELALAPCQSAEEAYWRGYAGQSDHLTKFPWNADMEDLLTMTPEDALHAIRARFHSYEGLFDLAL